MYETEIEINIYILRRIVGEQVTREGESGSWGEGEEKKERRKYKVTFSMKNSNVLGYLFNLDEPRFFSLALKVESVFSFDVYDGKKQVTGHGGPDVSIVENDWTWKWQVKIHSSGAVLLDDPLETRFEDEAEGGR